jgi:anti-sigma B factor antagonist
MIRLTVPCKLEYRDMALRVVAGACRIVRPRRATDVGPAEFDDQVVTAVGEAFTNVVLHGENPEGAVIDLEIDSAVDRLIVRLKDQGKPFDLSTVPVPDLDRAPESGLGVHIMKSWMDEVTYERGRPGANPSPNVLSMTRRLGEFTRTDDGEDTLLRIEGVLDALTVPNIRRTVEALVAEQRRRITVDLSGLRLIDSSGVGVIVSLHKRARAYGGVVQLAGLRDQPLAIFKLLKLERIFDL